MLNAKLKNKVITCNCIPLFDDNFRIADIIDKVKEEPIFRASDGKETLDQTGDGKETLVQTGDGKETLVQTGDGKETLVQILKQSVLSKLPSRDLRGYLHLTDSILDIIHNENLVSN